MPESFGARLRRRREEQNIALVTIAEQTKIKLSLLDALERDDVSHWPSGIFRRAYIRAYAQAIGLSPDAVVREFLEVHPEPEEFVAVTSAIATARDGERVNGGPPTRLHYLVGSAIGSLSKLRRNAAGSSSSPEVHQSDQTHAMDETPAPRARETLVPDLEAVAHLCTELGRVESAADVQSLLHDAARVLDASGLIVWMWNPSTSELRPALAHGYSDRVLAQLPGVRRDADNATAAAFRLAQTCSIEGIDGGSGALVVPLLTPLGCAGVLALELQRRNEQQSAIRAVATILAALLAQLLGGEQAAEMPMEAALYTGA